MHLLVSGLQALRLLSALAQLCGSDSASLLQRAA